DVAEGAAELAGDLLLGQDEVLAELDDLERVLDEDRADLLARPAGRARPQRVLGDAPAGERRHALELGLDRGEASVDRRDLVAPRGLAARAQRVALGEQGVAVD